MAAVGRCIGILVLLFLSISCRDADRPTAPSSLPQPPQSTTPPPNPAVPPLTGPAVSYAFSGPLSYPLRDYTMTSKYVLYEDGAFALQYVSLGGEYVGTYRQENGVFTFRFAGDSRWDASGTLRGDSLEVRYNVIMELSDFENAVYRRAK